MKTYKDLNIQEKRKLLLDCYISDGADEDTSHNVVDHASDTHVDWALRHQFNYYDDTVIE